LSIWTTAAPSKDLAFVTGQVIGRGSSGSRQQRRSAFVSNCSLLPSDNDGGAACFHEQKIGPDLV